jgi:choline/glycine/proline betaine transport protein
MYALMGMALAYAAYRRNLPLAIRSALYPSLRQADPRRPGARGRPRRDPGHDLRVATSLGIGVVQLNFGLRCSSASPRAAAQIGLIVLAVAAATVSAVSGDRPGDQRLSQLNVLLAIGLAVFVLSRGGRPSCSRLVLNVGDFVSSFPS